MMRSPKSTHPALPGLVMLGLALAGTAVSAEELPVGSGREGVRADAPEPAAPLPEDVKRIIKKLGSVRDFDRLGWILASAERQVPPVRAELLKLLDDQVQRLIQAEVELRSASVLSTTALTTASTSNQASAAGAASAMSRPPLSKDHPDLPDMKLFKTQSFSDAKARIEQADFVDPEQRSKTANDLSRLVLGVEDPEQRQELMRLLQQRNMEGARQYLDTQTQAAQGGTPPSE